MFKSKKSRILGGLLLFVLCVLALTAGAGYAYLESFSEAVTDEHGQTTDDGINRNEASSLKDLVEKGSAFLEPDIDYFLFLGCDAGVVGSKNSPKRTDTIMVATYNKKTHEVGLVSIPRDTRVVISGRTKEEKINAANAHGGISMIVNTIEDVFHIPIDYYVRVDYTALSAIVDILGGVEVNVKQNMHYDDNAGGLHIHFNKGVQTLDGDDAVNYLRYRGYQNADFGRQQAQQEFLRALLKTATKPSMLTKLPSIIMTLPDYVTTNMSASDMLDYAADITKVKIDEIVMTRIAGDMDYVYGGWYFFYEEEETYAIFNEVLRHLTPLAEGTEAPTVALINQTGVTGAAAYYRQMLESLGYTVVHSEMDETVDDLALTQVLDTSGTWKDTAQELTALFGAMEYKESDAGYEGADLTFYIGRNAVNAPEEE